MSSGLAAVIVAFAGPAFAQRPAPEIDHFLRGRSATRRGTVAALADREVSIAGRRTVRVGELAAEIFREHDSLTVEARRGRAALLEDPVVVDEVTEVEDSTIFTRRTQMTVVDPVAMRGSSPEFSRMNGAGRRLALAALTPQARADFEALRRDIAALPARHPLRQAADRGEQDLLDALAAGVGDYAVTTTVVVPKFAPTRDAAGRVQAPATNPDGSFASPAGPAAAGRAPTGLAVVVPRPTVNERGRCRHATRFLAGFTEGDSWVWSRRWDFAVGYFRLKASAWYGFGLRIPIEIDATQTPSTIVTRGERDVLSEYEVALGAATRNAGAEFYQSVGLPAADVRGGRELLLNAGFALTLTLDVVGAEVNVTIPGNGVFDFDADFAPPFGNCGTSCGPELWIPASVTRTNVNLGLIRGSAQVGVKLAGAGTVNVDFQALSGGRGIDSWMPGQRGQATGRHALSFEGPSARVRRVAELDRLAAADTATDFGYALSNPSYDWNVAVIPGLRAEVVIDAALFQKRIAVAPRWLDSLAFRPGTLHLGQHAGTSNRVELQHGEKRWASGRSTTLVPPLPRRWADVGNVRAAARRRRRGPRAPTASTAPRT